MKLIEIIGEASARLSPAFRENAPAVWSDVVGMRHRLVHDYMSIDFDLVWEVVQDDVPALIAALSH